MGGQRVTQLVGAAAGVAVQRQSAQALAQRGLQVGGQAVRVLHGVELEQAGGVLHGIGVHRLHVGADAGQRRQGIGLVHGSGPSRVTLAVVGWMVWTAP